MKKITLLIVSALLITGCQNLTPIKTEVEVLLPEGKSFKYQSEKDVIAEITVDPESGKLTGFKLNAVASAPALAQVERDTVAAQTSLAQMEALKSLTEPLNKLLPLIPAP